VAWRGTICGWCRHRVRRREIRILEIPFADGSRSSSPTLRFASARALRAFDIFPPNSRRRFGTTAHEVAGFSNKCPTVARTLNDGGISNGLLTRCTTLRSTRRSISLVVAGGSRDAADDFKLDRRDTTSARNAAVFRGNRSGSVRNGEDQNTRCRPVPEPSLTSRLSFATADRLCPHQRPTG